MRKRALAVPIVKYLQQNNCSTNDFVAILTQLIDLWINQERAFEVATASRYRHATVGEPQNELCQSLKSEKSI